MDDWPNAVTAELRQFYGNPVGLSSGASNSWKRSYLRKLEPPFEMFYCDVHGTRCEAADILIHTKCYNSLTRVLNQIKDRFSVDQITKYQLDTIGEAYSYRRERGSSKLSIHSYGCAIDLSPVLNKWKQPYDSKNDMMPLEVVGFFRAEGWTWGGLWTPPNPKHFQAAYPKGE